MSKIKLFSHDMNVLIQDYLFQEKYLNTLITFEQESRISLFSYNKEISFFRKLILDGNFSAASNFLSPLKSNEKFNFRESQFSLIFQEILENYEKICNSTDNDEINNLREKINLNLIEIKNFSDENQNKKILKLLKLNSIKDDDEFKNWSVNFGREKTFEKIRNYLKIIYPIEIENEQKIQKNLLIRLIKKIISEEKFSLGEICNQLEIFINNKNNNNNNNNKNNNNKNNNNNNYNKNIKNNNNNINNNINNNDFINIEKPIQSVSSILHQKKEKEKEKEKKKTETSNILSSIKDLHHTLPSSYDLYSYDPTSFTLDTLVVDSHAIRACCFCEKLEYLSLGSNSKSLKIYDFKNIINKFINRNSSFQPSLPLLFEKPNHHTGSIYCLDWARSGKLIATGSNDKVIKIVVVPESFNTSEIMELEISDKNYIKGTVRSVLFDPLNENRLLSAGTSDNNIYLWDTQTAEKTSTLFGHKSDIFSIKNCLNDDKIFGSCGKDKNLCFFDLNANTPFAQIEIKNHSEINDVSFSNEIVCSGHNDGFVCVCDFASKNVIKEFKAGDGEIRSLNLSFDGKFLMSSGFDKTTRIFDVNNDFKQVKVLDADDKVVCNRWFPDKPVIVTTSADKTARVYSPKVY